MRYITFVLSTFLFALLVACGGSGAASPVASSPSVRPTVAPSSLGPAPTTIPASPITAMAKGVTVVLPSGVGGRFAFAPGDGSIWLQDSPTGTPHVLVKASQDLFSEAPAFSPDGKEIAFRQLSLNPQAPAAATIQVINVDGTNQHALVNAPDPKSDVLWPAYSFDGQWVYYTVDSADHKQSEIRRVKSTGGDSAQVLADGRQAVLSPDGKRMAFIRFNVDNFSSAMWIADADGSNPRLLLSADTFLTIAGPHFSPDGKWILFAASGPPRHQLAVKPPSDCQPALLCALARPAYADGLPWDMWVISPDGKQYRQLTSIGGDSPWPVWSHDGKYVVFFQTNGIFLLDVNAGTIMQISRNGGHGVLDWWTGEG